MKKLNYLVTASILLIAFIVGGCSSPTTLESSLAYSCSVTGTVTAGSLATAGIATVTGLEVSITGGVGPSFQVTVPGVGTETTSTTVYSYPGTVTLTSLGNGQASGTFQVTDTGNNNDVATCTQSFEDTTIPTDGVVTITSSSGTTSLPLNVPVTLTAYYADSTTTTSDITYTFQLVNTNTYAGVNLATTGTNTATITASVSNSVTVTATAYEGAAGTGTIVGTGTQTFTFGTGTSTTGPVIITASPSTTASLGTAIFLSAYLPGYSTSGFTFSVESAIPGVTLNPGAVTAGYVTTATVTSTVATSVVILATSIVNPAETGTVTLQFLANGTIGTTGTLACTLGHLAETYYIGMPVQYNILTSTGEPVEITSWYNETNGVQISWVTNPPLPLEPPVSNSFPTSGYVSTFMSAQSLTRPGVVCTDAITGSTTMSDTVFVNAQPYY